jgi:hypothetical protein
VGSSGGGGTISWLLAKAGFKVVGFNFQVLESITKCPRSIFLDFTLGPQRAQAQPPHRSSCRRKGQRRMLTH